MGSYLAAIWRCRYFWLSLVKNDLRTRYRRSVLGMGWSLLHPICMTAILTAVFYKMFNQEDQPIAEYAPYVLAGLAAWNYIVTVVNHGCHCFFIGESYIRQYPAPLAIYPLRTALGGTVHFLLALSVVLLLSWYCKCPGCWVLRDGEKVRVRIREVRVGDHVVVNPGAQVPVDGTVLQWHSAGQKQRALAGQNFEESNGGPRKKVLAGSLNQFGKLTIRAERVPGRFAQFSALASLVPTLLLLFIFVWSAAVLAGVANVHFQDTQHLTEVGFQMLFYATPLIYYEKLLHDNKLGWFLNLNPLVPLLRLVRLPILYGKVPSLENYLVAVVIVLVTVVAAGWTLSRLQRRLIFYL